MGALDDAERAPMEPLALGEPLRMSEMAVLSDLDTLQEIEARGMITIDPGSRDAVLHLAANLAGDPELGARLAQLASEAGLGVSATPAAQPRPHHPQSLRRGRVRPGHRRAQRRRRPRGARLYRQRVHVLFWGLGRRDEAQAFVERAAGWSEDSQWAQRLDPWRLVLSGFVEGVDRYEEHVRRSSAASPTLRWTPVRAARPSWRTSSA